jgi:hypothetical protein
MRCKYHKTCPHYRDNQTTCKDDYSSFAYCGKYDNLYFMPNPFIEKPEKKPEVYVEQDNNIHLTDGAKLILKMAKMIREGTWKWESEPRKESWLSKHFKFFKRLGVMLP